MKVKYFVRLHPLFAGLQYKSSAEDSHTQIIPNHLRTPHSSISAIMKVLLAVLAITVLALAEPPVPSSQYLPSNQYGPPRPSSPPSSQYGAPAQTAAFLRSSAPSSQYGAPRPGGNYLPPGQGGYSQGSGGYRGGYDDQSEPANYNFKYDVQDAASGNDFGHEEARQGDVAQGKYYVLLPDGRRQTVQYVADNDGYKPQISYEQASSGFGGGFGGGYPSGGAGGYQGGAGRYQGGGGGYQQGGGAGGYQQGGGAGGYQQGGGNGGYQY